MKKTTLPRYNPQEIEPKWQAAWEASGLNNVELTTAPKPYYNLMMYPYPSAEGLHVGHLFAFSGADIHGRFKRMHGLDVFEPIGFDSGGIHSENFAIKMGVHPKIMTAKNIENFTRQLKRMGNAYDWNHTVDAMNPDYYKWTQWIFTRLFKAGLAYKKAAAVTWCPSCKTTLSDEQTEKKDDVTVCERCKTPIEHRFMKQWFFRITDYAERLLNNTFKLNWSPKVLATQRNWIGKSDGAQIQFTVEGTEKQVNVFTTRPDTLYGCTFFCLAPEHPLVPTITKEENKPAVEEYARKALSKSEQQRKAADKDKTGVFTGAYVVNPVNGVKVPIWVADYVLMDYGEGAVMGVPAHDERDLGFARKSDLPVKPVVLKAAEQARSFLMGAGNVTDADLAQVGAEVVKTLPSGARWVNIPHAKVRGYLDLVKEKLEPGFWNEVIGTQVWFIFKHKDNTVEEILLSEETESHVNALAVEFNNEALDERPVWVWLADNDWYRDLFIHTEGGTIINSGTWSGLKYPEDETKIIESLEEKGKGHHYTTYKLRDWCISRQRYWGPPIPMIYCPHCAVQGKSWFTENKAVLRQDKDDMSEAHAGWYPVPDDQLPVTLPDIDDYLPDGSGKSPLSRHKDFVETKCPVCGGKAERETDVSDTFLDSSWYFLRYPSTSGGDISQKRSQEHAFDPEITKKWLPVSQYSGGAEHSVLHLLYSRFVTMALHDQGLLDFEEPFPSFYAHGLIIKDGAKMSKSRGNVINPDEYIDRYGVDVLRLYFSFLGPYSEGGDVRDTGIAGMERFVRRIWRLVQDGDNEVTLSQAQERELESRRNLTIKKVTESIERFKYNTAIAALMELTRDIESVKETVGKSEANNYEDANRESSTGYRLALKTLLLLISPIAPHIAEELWQKITDSKTFEIPKSVHRQPWPVWVEAKIVSDLVTVVVQVNGKVRSKLEVEPQVASDNAQVLALARADERVQNFLNGKEVLKEITVPGKLVNFVVK